MAVRLPELHFFPAMVCPAVRAIVRLGRILCDALQPYIPTDHNPPAAFLALIDRVAAVCAASLLSSHRSHFAFTSLSSSKLFSTRVLSCSLYHIPVNLSRCKSRWFELFFTIFTITKQSDRSALTERSWIRSDLFQQCIPVRADAGRNPAAGDITSFYPKERKSQLINSGLQPDIKQKSPCAKPFGRVIVPMTELRFDAAGTMILPVYPVKCAFEAVSCIILGVSCIDSEWRFVIW